MKKVIGLVMALMLVCGAAIADDLSIGDTIKKLPGLKQGIGYSLLDEEICYLTTIECFNWQGLALEVGYASTDKAIAVISYELVNLKEKGVETPILNLIDARIGLYGGYGRLGLFDSEGNNEYDRGISLTLMNVKF